MSRLPTFLKPLNQDSEYDILFMRKISVFQLRDCVVCALYLVNVRKRCKYQDSELVVIRPLVYYLYVETKASLILKNCIVFAMEQKGPS